MVSLKGCVYKDNQEVDLGSEDYKSGDYYKSSCTRDTQISQSDYAGLDGAFEYPHLILALVCRY